MCDGGPELTITSSGRGNCAICRVSCAKCSAWLAHRSSDAPLDRSPLFRHFSHCHLPPIPDERSPGLHRPRFFRLSAVMMKRDAAHTLIRQARRSMPRMSAARHGRTERGRRASGSICCGGRTPERGPERQIGDRPPAAGITRPGFFITSAARRVSSAGSGISATRTAAQPWSVRRPVVGRSRRSDDDDRGTRSQLWASDRLSMASAQICAPATVAGRRGDRPVAIIENGWPTLSVKRTCRGLASPPTGRQPLLM
jgi:hypothetical protein